MTVKRAIITTLTVALFISLYVVYVFCSSTKDSDFDTWEVANAVFKIRVTPRKEMAAFTPGVFYSFHSAPVNSDNWNEIKTIKVDQPAPELRNQIRFTSDVVGYIFVSRYFIVTTDSGRSWQFWDAEKSLPDSQYLRKLNLWPAVKEVELQPDGNGTMVLYPISDKLEKGPTLHTTDYGRHWSL